MVAKLIQNLPNGFNRVQISIALVIGGLILLAGAIYGYHYYRLAALKAEIEKLLGRDSAYTETILKLGYESQTITYSEGFKLCDQSIEKRTELILNLRGISPDIGFDLRERLIHFLQAENDLVRAKKDLFYVRDKFDTELLKMQLLIDSGRKGDMRLQVFQMMSKDIKKRIDELSPKLDEANKRFVGIYSSLLKEEKELATKMRDSGIKFREVLRTHEGTNKLLSDGAKNKELSL